MQKLYIDSIDFVRFDGDSSTPTAILFTSDDDWIVGMDALRQESPHSIVNRGFKLALGAISPKASVESRRLFRTAKGGDRTAFNISREFCISILEHAQEWVIQQGLSPASNVIVSEPLKFYVDDQRDDWLQNYRTHMRNILTQKFARIDFLPEPFAVFQYYRLGRQHPAVQGARKFVALVLDFGGGTFDASVIETTKDGDLSQSGSNSKPFAASSAPIGGDFIDEVIAEFCMPQVLQTDTDKKKLNQVFRKIPGWDATILPDLNEANFAVYQWLQYTKHKAEQAKIRLCRAIHSWRLDCVPVQTVAVEVPVNPFDKNSALTSVNLSSQQFFELFEQHVWNRRVRGIVKAAFRRAKEALGGKTVNLLLLSGGSCNVGWVRELIDRDFHDELSEADHLSLTSDFQTVVAQGLAVECARRHLLDSGDDQSTPPAGAGRLSVAAGARSDIGKHAKDATNPTSVGECVSDAAVRSRLTEEPTDLVAASQVKSATRGSLAGLTYNALSLALSSADADSPEFVRLQPWGSTKDLVPAQRAGVVLDAGSDLQMLVGHTLTWKIKLPRAPKHRLRYLFTRSTQPISDGEYNYGDIYNLQEKYLNTKGFKSFGGHIWLELDVALDGTCRPRFVYARNREAEPLEVRQCVPFALDSVDVEALPRKVLVEADTRHGRAGANARAGDARAHQDSLPGGNRGPLSPTGIYGPESAFFGFDFGSTNSSISYVSKRSIQITNARGVDYQWGSLRENIESLPTPVAHAAVDYLKPRTGREQSLNALELFEAAYAFLAYFTYSESRTVGRKQTHLLKQFRHRSAGPLIDLLNNSIDKIGAQRGVCSAVIEMKPTLLGSRNDIREELNDLKHNKRETLSRRTERFCEEAALCVARALNGKYFGHFTDIRSDPFSSRCTGSLSFLNGTSAAVDSVLCSTESQLFPNIPYVVDPASGRSVCLAPVMICGLADRADEIWLYDGPKPDGVWSFKSAVRSKETTISDESNRGLSELLKRLTDVDDKHRADLNCTVIVEGKDG